MKSPSLVYRALLWDIDGTLIDTTSLIIATLNQTYLRFLGRTLPPSDLRALIGIPLCEQMRVFGDPAGFGVAQAEMESAFIRDYEADRELERPIPEAIEVLIRAHSEGRPTALVTSKNLSEIANTLPRLGIAASVDAIVSADDVRSPKPHPEGVLLALERIGARPDEALFIGDTVHDLRAGSGAGVARCAVTWGAGPREMLLAERPELICDEPARLWEALSVER